MSWFGFGEEEVIDPNRKKLVIDLIGGKDITDPKTRNRPEGPLFGDVFCVLKCGRQQFQSEIIKKSMNPTWGQTFSFELDELPESAVIEITCYFSGVLSNTLIGEVRIPVVEHKDISFQFSLSHWFTLYNPKLSKKDGSPGEIGLKIGAEGGNMFKDSATNNNSYDCNDDRTAEEIYEEANKFANDGNASAKRSLRLAEQTRDISAQTSVILREQGIQIEKMQMDMETIHNNMRQSERKLRSIESVWGSVANKVTSSSNARYKKKAHLDRKLNKKRKREDEKIRKLKEATWEERKESDRYNNRKRDNMIQKDPGSRRAESGSQEEQFYETIDDTDRTVDLISLALDDVKTISMDMNTQLQIDAERLSALKYDVDRAVPRMDDATRRSRAIVKG